MAPRTLLTLLVALAACSKAEIIDSPRGDSRAPGDSATAGDGSTGDAASGDAAPGDEPPPCTDPNQHRCDGICVDNDSVEHCGDRCTPCPSVTHGTPSCDGQTCGFTCTTGYFSCLGECLPDAQAPCGVSMPANTWVQLTSGETGPRMNPAMIYLDSTAEYVLVGGSMTYSATPRVYDVQGIALTDPVWRNHHPPGSGFTPDIGISSAPGFSNEHFGFADSEGNVRPNWATYPGIPSYFQYAYNATTATLVMYLWNRTFSYDAIDRVWTPNAPATDPAGGASEPRLLWGAMTFDEVDDEVLLFGGGNVLNAEGRPHTWIYEVQNDTWRRVTGTEPGPRALSRLVTDPDRRKALLFGGDELDRLKSDTWEFDFATETWAQRTPTVAPSPRGGHHLLFLPTSRTTVLIGGYEYDDTTSYVASHFATKPWEIWRYDWDTPTWDLVKRFESTETQPSFWLSRNFSYGAAAGPGDVVVAHLRNGYPADHDQGETWAIRVDVSVTDAAGTTTYGVAANTDEWRGGQYHPDWYTTGWPAPDPTAHATLLAGIPDNTWTEIDVPNRPTFNHDWGTVALDPVNHVMYRWSGGHSAHSGTDVLEYDITSNRFSMSYVPEIPPDFEYSNDQTPGQWSFDNNPWMTGHTYKTYAFSSALGRVVLYKRPRTYYYDPTAHDWELDTGVTDAGGSMYTDVLCPVPGGVVMWTPNGLWDLDTGTRTWTERAVTGATLPQLSPDRNILVYDSARDRLLLFASTGSDHGQVVAVDMATNAATALDPTGQAALAANAGTFWREAVYVPSSDLVFMGTHYDSSTGTTPVYDVGENRWYAYDVDPNDEQGSFFDVSLGLAIDDQERIWAINTDSQIFLLKLDAASATRTGL